MKNHLIVYVLLGIMLMPACQTRHQDHPEITVKELRDHVFYLASDELRGRYPGTEGSLAAAGYIREQFVNAGLTLLADSGFHAFDVITGRKTGSNTSLVINGDTAQLGRDYNPMPFTGNGSHHSGVVFAGYGLQTRWGDRVWDDYKNIEVRDRWVMILRGAPDKESLKKNFMGQSRDSKKALLAKDLGAAGVLFVSGPSFDAHDRLVDPTGKQGDIDIPVIHITRDLANQTLRQTTVREAEEKIHQKGTSLSFNLESKVSGYTEMIPVRAIARNVVAELRAPDDNNSQRYILVGGHFDHLGMGGEGTGSRAPDTTAVHNGADDNASGIAAMIEIAEKIRSMNDSLKSNVIFAGFDAEEMGLIGSRHLVSSGVIDPERVDAMINLDMIGRLRDERSLQVGGIGTSAEAEEIIRRLNTADTFRLGLTPEGYGPSDHSSFYSQDIPVFFFSTGPHLDYHTPRDDADRLNYSGLKEIADLVAELVWELANRNTGLTFREAGPKMQEGRDNNRSQMKVTLGIMPDFAGVEDRGLRADLVIEGKAADRAGMKNGDIITAINGKPVGDVYDYMDRMGEFEHGMTITVEAIRGKEKMVFMVQL